MPQPGTRVFELLPAVAIKPCTPRAFALALVSVGMAAGIRWTAGVLDPTAPPFPAFLLGTMITAILAGAAAGVTSASFGLALAWWFFSGAVPNAFSSMALLQYIAISGLIVWIATEYRRLLRFSQERHRTAERQMRLITAENATLTLMASDRPLDETLTHLARTIEQYTDGSALASILLLDADGKRLRHCTAPSLPNSYIRQIDGLRIGPSVGSCGAAAYLGEPIYVENISQHANWENFRDVALTHGLRACWSTPIISRLGTVLGTFAVYHREPRAPDPTEIEIVSLLVTIASLAIERERGREQRRLLMNELAHRIKNSLAVVNAIASSTLRPHVEEDKYNDFQQRLLALAQVQSFIAQTNWSSIDLRDLIQNVATVPFRRGEGRFRFSGPSVRLPAQLTMNFALAIHELCTNAVKYGALKSDHGTINVEWGYDTGGGSEEFYLKWAERDGEPVQGPTKLGFGSRMIKSAFARSVGGDAIWRYPTEGLECEIRLPAAALLAEVRPQQTVGF